MTLQEILTGPVTERQNGAAHLMTEVEARGILHKIEKHQPRNRRGPVVAKLADAAARGIGRLSPDAIALYRAYAVDYGA